MIIHLLSGKLVVAQSITFRKFGMITVYKSNGKTKFVDTALIHSITTDIDKAK